MQGLEEVAVGDFVEASQRSLVKNVAVRECNAGDKTNANVKPCYMPTCSFKTGKGGSNSSLHLHSALQKLREVDEVCIRHGTCCHRARSWVRQADRSLGGFAKPCGVH